MKKVIFTFCFFHSPPIENILLGNVAETSCNRVFTIEKLLPEHFDRKIFSIFDFFSFSVFNFQILP